MPLPIMPTNQWPKPQPPPASQPQKSLFGRPFIWDLLLLALNILVLLSIPALMLSALMDLVVFHNYKSCVIRALLAWAYWRIFKRLPI